MSKTIDHHVTLNIPFKGVWEFLWGKNNLFGSKVESAASIQSHFWVCIVILAMGATQLPCSRVGSGSPQLPHCLDGTRLPAVRPASASGNRQPTLLPGADPEGEDPEYLMELVTSINTIFAYITNNFIEQKLSMHKEYCKAI